MEGLYKNEYAWQLTDSQQQRPQSYNLKGWILPTPWMSLKVESSPKPSDESPDGWHLDFKLGVHWAELNIQKTKIMASGPITSWEIDGETVETVADIIFGASKSLQMVIAAMKLKDACSLEEKLWPT